MDEAVDRELLRSLFERRRVAFERFAAWERTQSPMRGGASALASIGALLHLMPAEVRDRPIDTRGVAAMHRILAVLR